MRKTSSSPYKATKALNGTASIYKMFGYSTIEKLEYFANWNTFERKKRNII